MSHSDFKASCPVCGMSQIDPTLVFVFQGVEHYFCTTQCLERFQSHPHLFVGDPQHGHAAKQKNESILKQRRIKLNIQIDAALRDQLEKAIESLMGVIRLKIAQQELFVTYDLLQVSLETIERAIEGCAEALNTSLMENLKRGLIHYSEECELGNIEHLTK